MITPRSHVPGEAVALHYDELDWIYRDVWGEHVHHGLWLDNTLPPADAARALVLAVAREAGIGRGARVCDVGCGYGATARLLVSEYEVNVTAITLSSAQYEYACRHSPGTANPSYLLGDWLCNQFEDCSFDAVIALESSEHMEDKARCCAEACRVLKPGGRFVICAWLAAENPAPWQIRHLLEPICHEGRLAGMGSESEYRRWLREAGLVVRRAQDFTRQVRRTWPICIGRFAKGLLHRPAYRRLLLDRQNHNRIFALTLFRLWLAYRCGAMRYVMFTAQRQPIT